MQRLFILLPSVVTPKFGILAINSDLFCKNGWRSLLYFCSTFKNLLTGLFIKSISFCTSSTCSIASCCSFSSLSKFEEADASSGLEAGVGLTFLFFFSPWMEVKTGVWGPCWGKKKKAKNPPRGGERYWKLRELRLFYFYFERFSFILKYKLRGSCKTEPSSPV